MTHAGKRLRDLRREMQRIGIDGLVVSGAANRYYLSGFTGDNGILFVDAREHLLFTDFRYVEQARQEAPAFEPVKLGRRLWPEFGQWLGGRACSRVGIEATHISLEDYEELVKAVPAERLVRQVGLIERLRAVKEPGELERIARAAAINDRAWARLLPTIETGLCEQDLATELEFLLRREGAEGTAFPVIVASGPRGALPHGTASAKRLLPGELVVFDFGARLDGYASDMTRTIALGSLDEKGRTIYRVVLEAQTAALAVLRSGLNAREVDAVARRRIAESGYGDFFGHGLGHAVGIEVHEAPALSSSAEEVLAPGMVLTVEPGIYLPGYGGVRLEDLVIITADGCRDLTASPKELLIV